MREHVSIAPSRDLETTAHLIGKVTGAKFDKDTSGYYEEFPAYVAEKAGVKFSLLGPPLPEYDIREHKHDYYHLIVEFVDGRPDERVIETELGDLISRLSSEGIACLPLKMLNP